jgi:excisionase family DNA binding protein
MGTSSNSDSLSDSLRTESHIAVLDLREAAAVLHCHPKTLRLMAKAKKIPALRVGKLWRFSEKRLREWLEAS